MGSGISVAFLDFIMEEVQTVVASSILIEIIAIEFIALTRLLAQYQDQNTGNRIAINCT